LARAALFLRAGYAVLVYDKRGTGISTGSWQDAGVDELAGDALGAIAWLRQQTDILPDRIGLAGQSQGGWVICRALARSSDVAFAVIFSGGAVSAREQEMFRAAKAAEKLKLPAEGTQAAKHLMDLKWGYAAGTTGWAEDATAAQSALGTPVAAIVEPILTADSPTWRGMQREAAYDPALDLARLRVPTLVLLGAEDELLPVQRVSDLWAKEVPASSRFVTVKMLPGVGHPLVDTKAGAAFPGTLVSTLTEWLAAREAIR